MTHPFKPGPRRFIDGTPKGRPGCNEWLGYDTEDGDRYCGDPEVGHGEVKMPVLDDEEDPTPALGMVTVQHPASSAAQRPQKHVLTVDQYRTALEGFFNEVQSVLPGHPDAAAKYASAIADLWAVVGLD